MYLTTIFLEELHHMSVNYLSKSFLIYYIKLRFYLFSEREFCSLLVITNRVHLLTNKYFCTFVDVVTTCWIRKQIKHLTDISDTV